jgi:hypothetical protein
MFVFGVVAGECCLQLGGARQFYPAGDVRHSAQVWLFFQGPDASTLGMAADNNMAYPKAKHSILDGSANGIAGHAERGNQVGHGPNYKQVSRVCANYQFGDNARIGAADPESGRMLPLFRKLEKRIFVPLESL